MAKDSKLGQTAKILSFHPTGEYYYSKGLKAHHRRDLYKAKKYFERALELEPTEPMIACQLAITCTEIGEYSRSNNLLENVLHVLDPYMTECHYFLANNYAHLGMFKEAYRHASAYLDKEEDGEFCEDAEDLLDLIMFEADETEESLAHEDGLIFKQEEAREYLEAGNFQKAIEVLNETIKEHPDFWSAYNNLALAYFYLGKTEEAFNTLEEILAKSPGNLHALCNMVVFHYYQHSDEKVEELVKALAKVRPMLMEHRFKLGATFALIGKYAFAYKWLKQLQKLGFEGDGTFYYWLSMSAFHLGHERTALRAWKKVLEINPEKEGLEPWNDLNSAVNGFEHHLPSIIKRLGSEFIEERLFAIFLAKHSTQKEHVLMHPAFQKNPLFTSLEKEYAATVKEPGREKTQPAIDFANQTAEMLYHHFHPVQLPEAGLYLMWFSVFVEARKTNQKLTNPAGWAAALEYIWQRLRNERKSQPEIAEKHFISVSTLSKYVKLVNALLQ
ncbi:tetratricopeptide repeat protein [Peribacillus cavernae]|uniref:Tetratricopeptide repeat protein n=1 Tax=Peribacillus cavernae TaxID=1674310 RepID=A0A3S0UHZ6_9BACI|nr:tetratricopeptide repeat protein [Peribacillus cavernae]MDQ0220029.1 tetratricopeptide (TPR) repeat protein [Peribacillus cavernae]RUQ32090.1 tetratricopeptide repeat protein [Peribacillus cavernae]